MLWKLLPLNRLAQLKLQKIHMTLDVILYTFHGLLSTLVPQQLYMTVHFNRHQSKTQCTQYVADLVRHNPSLVCVRMQECGCYSVLPAYNSVKDGSNKKVL